MPTTNPRLAITITPRTRQVLARISRATRQPASGVVRDLLDESTPMLEQVAATMEALQAQTASFKGQVARKLDRAERQAFRHAAAALDVLAEIQRSADGDRASDAPKGRRRPARQTPGSVTRG